MKKAMLATLLTVVTTLGVSAQSTGTNFTFNTGDTPAFSLQNAELFVNDKLIKEGFSVSQSEFNFLFIYVPDQGLFTISKDEFEGSSQNGSFNGKNLSLKIEDVSVTLNSSSVILKDVSSPAWTKFDSKFKLATDAVIIGYGNKENVPYDWKKQIKADQ